jgi:hypothetical protein
MTRIRVLHRRMELIYPVISTRAFTLLNHQVEKIDSSAEALRVYHHPFYLSLRK